MITLSKSQRQAICNHAESTYPEECCGLLIGRMEQEQKILQEVWATKNCWGEAGNLGERKRELDKRSRFAIDPQVLLTAQKTTRERHLSIIGIYHSHPNSPARPSEFDRAIAWAEYSYLIVSVPQGRAGEMFSWVLDEKHQFQQEEMLFT